MKKLFVILPILVILLPTLLGIYFLRSRDAGTSLTPGIGSEPLNDEIRIEMPTDTQQSFLSSGGGNAPVNAELENSRIDIIQDGEIIPILNGQSVSISDNWQVEIFVSPYPPDSFQTTVDFYLTTNDGEPITNAQVAIGYDMAFMYHGEQRSRIQNLGGGHYLTTLETYMYGLWDLTITISISDVSTEQELFWSLYVWPVR